ncbi:MAG: hypothetical protein K2P94_15435 [Rhodospirillaceae bacterium]|nr:hypothetical protein [Rhodospirillaceae bacterium]
MPPSKTNSGFTPQLPPKQVCGKCEAEFRWEPSDPLVKGSPLVARLSKPSDECDCGYGNAPPPLELR